MMRALVLNQFCSSKNPTLLYLFSVYRNLLSGFRILQVQDFYTK